MLILQRKAQEAILIGEDIRVVLLESDGGGARLGIEAPDHISILREEIVEQVRAETVRASRAASGEEGDFGGLKPPKVDREKADDREGGGDRE